MKLKSDADILRYLHALSVEKGVKLSPTICGFFIALCRLCLEEGLYDEEKQKLYVQYSCREFVEVLSFSFRMVCVSLNALEDCGLIERVEVQREFRRLPNNEFNTNKPSITYLDIIPFIEE